MNHSHSDPLAGSAVPEEPWQTKEVLEHAKHDLQARLSDVREAAAHTVHGVRATASTTAAAARDGYQAMRHDAVIHFSSYREEIEHHIRQEPLKSVGLAALAGVVVGLLARR
jgi:ElaB/YqjD/DUF883 family membrane-anchored ribosome-binding protein